MEVRRVQSHGLRELAAGVDGVSDLQVGVSQVFVQGGPPRSRPNRDREVYDGRVPILGANRLIGLLVRAGSLRPTQRRQRQRQNYRATSHR